MSSPTADLDAPAVLEWDHASIGYAGRPAVEGLSLTVRRGEVVGLLGPNGSGKSTLVRGALGLAEVLGGSVRLFGVDRRRFRQWRRLGYVPQRQATVGGVPSTVREVVSGGRLTHLRPWQRPGGEDKRAIDRALAAVDLADRAKVPVVRLSGGQQRRVLIARALATEPDLLVLDEPTAGVDQASQEALAATLERLVARGMTVVLVTHELGAVEPLFTRAVVLRDGAIVHDGACTSAPVLDTDDDWRHPHGEPPARPTIGLTGMSG